MSNGPTILDWAEVAAERKAEIDRLRSRLAASERRNEWMLHNGGTWCNEFPKEWMPSIHGPLIPWLSKRIDDAARTDDTGEKT